MNRKFIILLIFLVVLLSVSTVSAADNATSNIASVEKTTDEIVSVEENQVILSENNESGTFADLQSEINNAPEGSVLNLTRDYNGAYDYRIQLNKNLTINGQGHTLNCLGEKDCSAFYSNSGYIILKNLKIINGKNDFNQKGGAIYIEGSAQYTIINCTFNNNWADDYGGAIYNDINKPLTIINCNFDNNKADDDHGGAIYSKGELDIKNSTFTSNIASYDGGAFYCEKFIYVENCLFENNHACAGGAIYSQNNVRVKNTCFKGNDADEYGKNPRFGGAIQSEGNVEVDNSTFTSNRAFNSGGAIYANTVSIFSSTFRENNVNLSYGGAICANTVSISSSTFRENIAHHTGGAVYVGDSIDIRDSEFYGNEVDIDAGAIFCKNNVNLKNTTFGNNKAITKGDTWTERFSGGAILCEGDVKIDNCSFLNNQATNKGGAIYADTITWVDSPSYFIGNNVDNNKGGAIYTNKFNTNLRFGIFINNTVKCSDDGGAIYINMDNYITVYQCYFENNRCGDEGGAIYLDYPSSTLTLENNIFIDNWAGDKGNIVYNKGHYIRIHNNWYGGNKFDFSNELVEYRFWESDESYKDDEPVLVEFSLIETSQPCTLIVRFISDGELFNYDAEFNADNGAIITNHKKGNNTVTSDITFKYGITTVNATVNKEVLTLSYSFSKENVTMDVNVPEISFGDNATVNIIFTPSNATGTVVVGNVSATIVNGTLNLIISNLSVGNHTFLVSYSGDGLYNPKYENVTITVNRKNLDIDASAEPIYQGENATVIVTGLEGATGNVTVTIYNNNWTGQITNGTATIIIPGLQENSTGNVTYVGDVNYSNASTVINIVVNSDPRVDLNISASADPIMVSENATVIVTGLENATGNVTVSIGGDKWYGEINNGTATVIVTGLKMNVTASVFYPGDYEYNNATTTVNITVNPAIRVWYVNGSKEYSGNGTTPETAFKTLQEALNKSPEDSTIYIAPGTYTGENNTNLTIDKNLTFINYGEGEVIFDAQFNSRIWTVNAGRINITGLTFKNGKEEYVCGAILFNQTLNNSYINAIFIGNNVVDGLAGAIGFYTDVINTNINSIFINNSVSKGYGGAIFFNGNLNNVNISGNYTSNIADDAGAIFFYGNLFDVNISGYYNNNRANDTAGVFLFYSNLINVIISGDYIGNVAQYCAVCYINELTTINNSHISGNYYNNSADYCVVLSIGGIISNSNISGNYINNHAIKGINFIEESYNISMSGNYVNNNISNGSVIYIRNCDENSSIHDSIFINNTIDDELIIDVMSGSVLSLNNWFGNNANNYYIKPQVSEYVTMFNWLFLNGTTNSTSEIKVNETSLITFILYSYNNVSEEIKEYDASKMNIKLDLSQIHGILNQTTALINETILYTCLEEGVASVTGRFETASYTIILAPKTNTIVTINPIINPELGKEITINYTTNSNGTVTIKVNGEVISGDKFTPTTVGTYNVTVEVAENDYYTVGYNETSFTVEKTNTTVVINPIVDVVVGQVVTITYNTNSNGTVTVKVNGQPIVDAKFTPSQEGVYNVTVEVAENDYYTAATNETSFLVKLASKITASPVTTTYNVGKYLVITLKDSNGKSISGAVLTVNLGGSKKYTTNDNGQVKINVATLIPKTYNAKITYAGSDNIKGSTGSVKVTVKKAKPKITAKAARYKLNVKTKKYTAIFKDNKNRAIKNTKVTLKVYGKTYSVKTNSKGQGVFKITNLKKIGSYIAVITFPANKYYNKLTKKVKIIVK